MFHFPHKARAIRTMPKRLTMPSFGAKVSLFIVIVFWLILVHLHKRNRDNIQDTLFVAVIGISIYYNARLYYRQPCGCCIYKRIFNSIHSMFSFVYRYVLFILHVVPRRQLSTPHGHMLDTLD